MLVERQSKSSFWLFVLALMVTLPVYFLLMGTILAMFLVGLAEWDDVKELLG